MLISLLSLFRLVDGEGSFGKFTVLGEIREERWRVREGVDGWGGEKGCV